MTNRKHWMTSQLLTKPMTINALCVNYVNVKDKLLTNFANSKSMYLDIFIYL